VDKITLAIGLQAVWTAWLWWFFFGPRKRATAQAGAGGVQELEITVQGGYSPSRIVLKRGVPVRLKFRRLETASCSERVIFPDFDITKKLPTNELTTVEFTPDKSGTFTFSCGMGMYQGTVVVEGGDAA